MAVCLAARVQKWQNLKVRSCISQKLEASEKNVFLIWNKQTKYILNLLLFVHFQKNFLLTSDNFMALKFQAKTRRFQNYWAFVANINSIDFYNAYENTFKTFVFGEILNICWYFCEICRRYRTLRTGICISDKDLYVQKEKFGSQ